MNIREQLEEKMYAAIHRDSHTEFQDKVCADVAIEFAIDVLVEIAWTPISDAPETLRNKISELQSLLKS